jgi:hypothetical protein
MAIKNYFRLGCLLVFFCVGRRPALGMIPADLKDPAKTLARSKISLEIVEAFLVLQETGAVKAYRETLITRGKDETSSRVRFLEELYAGNNAGALQMLDLIKKKDSWVAAREKYLNGLMEIQRPFTDTKSDHFIVRTPAEDNFLARYAVPSLENVYGRVAEFFRSSPTVSSVIEIYPTLDTFAFATARPKEEIEQTRSVVTSFFGRVMILSPGATTLGYRWLDGMVHEYVQKHLNRVSGGNCPAWFQEGAAGYFEVAWRRPEGFIHSPSERALLTRAILSDTGTVVGLHPFEKMDAPSPKLMSQEQRTLVLAETSDAVDFMVQEFGVDKLWALIHSFRGLSRSESFENVLGMSEADFEKSWRDSLADLTVVPTDLARGTTCSWRETRRAPFSAKAINSIRRGS